MKEISYSFQFDATIWLYPGDAAWNFVSLPRMRSVEVAANVRTKERRGWGAVRVEVTIGESTWRTSLFPSKRDGGYILPIKATVRRREHVHEGDRVTVALTVL